MERLQQFLDLAATSNHGRSKIGWRYSHEQRELATAYCHDRREEG